MYEFLQRTGDFTFLLVLPTERYGLDNLMNKLSAENLTHIFSHTEKRRVHLQMPKFEIDTDGDLIPTLHSVSMPSHSCSILFVSFSNCNDHHLDIKILKNIILDFKRNI